jgi:UDP-glucose 4-epimerase
MPKILVTGGMGYIGSHTIIDLVNHGFEVVSIDNFLNSKISAIQNIEKVLGQTIENHNIDLCDLKKTKAFFKKNKDIQGIIHFAALKAVEESVELPLLYYQNNVGSLINILTCVKEFNIPNFIFSSSCTVYGDVKTSPVTEETHWLEAACPYGYTKQMGEVMIRDFAKVNPSTNSILLRYFNPAGAHESGHIGEDPLKKAAALVPIITETAIGKRKSMTVFGSDYDTRDGSCIRDFIHVMDLANAHTKALEYLFNHENTQNCEVFNVGIGQGVTIMEAIRAFETETNIKLQYSIGDRRPGDVEAIFSNFEKANQLLKWSPKRNVRDIMRDAWQWEKNKS